MACGRNSASGAAEVVDEVGARMASLVATLRDPVTAAAATGGRRTYLEVWQGLHAVFLAGGLLKGIVGERVTVRAAAILTAAGVNAPAVRAAPHRERLALLGAARSASGHHPRVVVLDRGHTWIKCGVAAVHEGELTGVDVLPPVPVGAIPLPELRAGVTSAAARLVGTHPQTAGEVVCSIASYVRDGRPITDRSSVYEGLDPVSMQAELEVPVRLVHDGTAAWRGTGTDARSAVIVMGTWLGVGIGPHRRPLRPYAGGFEIRTGAVDV